MNPEILRWARERAGYSLDAAAEKMRKPPEVLRAWESGDSAPTYRQLQDMARRLYKRPVALFFFSNPPEEEELSGEFRTLPEERLTELEPDTRFAIREAHAFRQSLYELTGGTNPAERNILRDLSVDQVASADHLATEVRAYLDVTVEVQMQWRDNREALKQWRDRVESVGVFVFKRPFSQRSISGFCLHDDVLPLIMINNSTAQARQIFTLFHELGHLLYGISSVTPIDVWQVDDLPLATRWIEISCNRFAAELLLPPDTFPDIPVHFDPGTFSTRVARQFNVSREVVLRRLFDMEIVDFATYNELAANWSDEYREAAAGQSGGDYYANQATYLGNSFIELAFSKYQRGDIDLGDLASHLRVKAKNVASFESYLAARR
jgi:Zn-dependent peptidase ImmA (M78 family)/transcriptional regulator with XRE-family HTH domain